ncbi:excalibur calcium-binding domain-containing protein [Pseudonocardia sp. NPDC046786]|uniref:excalibur calcium-binding domain-containing protein n=1 Tax=Pseudonocardia sp. NPDC046786 TaxID=3155471 RepID=UPI00340BE146
MRLRTLPAAALLAVAATVPLAGAAFAQDRDCADFSSQEEAQAALLPGDPERLDADGDGVACENHAYAGTAPTGTGSSDSGDGATQVSATPVGGVEAGGGPAEMLPVALGALAAGGVGAFAARRMAGARRG